MLASRSNSQIIYNSLLYLLAVKKSCYDYIGGICDVYSLVRDLWRASRDWRCSFGGGW